MGRARLRLEVLPKEKARRKTYETRKKCLEKKAKELSTLCGVDLCMIMYPPPLKNKEAEPFVWSNNPEQVANLIESYKLSRLGGEYSRSRTYDLAWFYEDQTRKTEEEIKKVKKRIRELKYPNCEEQYGSLSSEELRMFAGVLNAKVESAKETIELLKERIVLEIPDSSFLMNPLIEENPDSSLGGSLVQHPLPTYFDAQSYLEHQRRMMMMMGAYHGNGFDSFPLMGYDMQNVAPSVPEYGQAAAMISPGYFPQMYSGFHPNLGFEWGISG